MLTQPLRVGVGDLAEQQFSPDSHDLDAHGSSLSSGGIASWAGGRGGSRGTSGAVGRGLAAVYVVLHPGEHGQEGRTDMNPLKKDGVFH